MFLLKLSSHSGVQIAVPIFEIFCSFPFSSLLLPYFSVLSMLENFIILLNRITICLS
jgi:hypothetical protein